MKEKPSIFEWLILFVFVVLEIVIFWLRIVTPPSELNQLDNVLYSSFEVIFSLYIGYFLQRIDSVRQFQESLKRYGLSAYRRIMDIRKSVDRSIIQIDKMNKDYPKDRVNDIDVLRHILEGTFDTVESSVADWGDIIGEEIRKKERADLLQEKLAKSEERFNLSADDKKTIEELRSELNKINSELPLALRGDNINKEIEQQNEIFYAHYLESSITRDKYMTLFIKPNLDITEENVRKIIGMQPFFFHISYAGMGTMECLVYDKGKNEIGYVVNPIIPHDKRYYVSELQVAFKFLDLQDKESQIPIYKLSDLKYAGITNDGSMLIMQLPIEGAYYPRG